MKPLPHILPKRLGARAAPGRSFSFSRWTVSTCTRVNPSSSPQRPFTSHHAARATSQPVKLPLDRFSGTQISRDALNLVRQGILFDSSGNLLIPAAELRNACKCKLCVNPSDRQRNYNWAEIPSDIDVAEHQVDSEGRYQLRWKNDVPGFEGHISSYTRALISSMPVFWRQRGHSAFSSTRKTTLWAKEDYDMDAATIAYDDYMENGESLKVVLDQLHSTGLVFITDVPKSDLSVSRIGERIGALRNTFYGSTWDVRSVPDAKNVAYTSRNLGFHMDLLYMLEPPGLQLLHCLENTCEGGHSQFVDSLKAVDLLIDHHGQELFSDLCDARVDYEYSNDGFYYFDQKPIISLRGYPHRNRNMKNAKNFELLSKVKKNILEPDV